MNRFKNRCNTSKGIRHFLAIRYNTCRKEKRKHALVFFRDAPGKTTLKYLCVSVEKFAADFPGAFPRPKRAFPDAISNFQLKKIDVALLAIGSYRQITTAPYTLYKYRFFFRYFISRRVLFINHTLWNDIVFFSG